VKRLEDIEEDDDDLKRLVDIEKGTDLEEHG